MESLGDKAKEPESSQRGFEPELRRTLMTVTRRYAEGLVRDDWAVPDNDVKDDIETNVSVSLVVWVTLTLYSGFGRPRNLSFCCTISAQAESSSASSMGSQLYVKKYSLDSTITNKSSNSSAKRRVPRQVSPYIPSRRWKSILCRCMPFVARNPTISCLTAVMRCRPGETNRHTSR